jgi:hypothetical protein
MSRPGLMIRGKVVMAPSHADMTQQRFELDARFIAGSRVYRNGLFYPEAVAYDENKGTILLQKCTPNGDALPLQMLTGEITAVPRA